MTQCLKCQSANVVAGKIGGTRGIPVFPASESAIVVIVSARRHTS